MNKLKPCPFCGSEHVEAESFEYGWAKCVICGSAAKKSHWNNRQELEPQPNQIVVNWITYDGSLDTFPKIGQFVVVFGEFTNSVGIWDKFSIIAIGEQWAYFLAPPEVECE